VCVFSVSHPWGQCSRNMPTAPLDEQAPRCRKGTGPFALFAALCVFCVGPCFYRLTAAIAAKLGYVSAHGVEPGQDGVESRCFRRLV
jgi:hypothetical protein